MVNIENNETMQAIRSRDSQVTFFYCDPPYFNAEEGNKIEITSNHLIFFHHELNLNIFRRFGYGCKKRI